MKQQTQSGCKQFLRAITTSPHCSMFLSFDKDHSTFQREQQSQKLSKCLKNCCKGWTVVYFWAIQTCLSKNSGLFLHDCSPTKTKKPLKHNTNQSFIRLHFMKDSHCTHQNTKKSTKFHWKLLKKVPACEKQQCASNPACAIFFTGDKQSWYSFWSHKACELTRYMSFARQKGNTDRKEYQTIQNVSKTPGFLLARKHDCSPTKTNFEAQTHKKMFALSHFLSKRQPLHTSKQPKVHLFQVQNHEQPNFRKKFWSTPWTSNV